MSRGRDGLWARTRDETDAIEDKGVAGENHEQEHTLEHSGDLVGNAERDLRRLAAEIAHREHEAGEQHADRVEPAEEGYDYGGEAIARRDTGLQLADGSRDLANPGKPGEPARQQE